MDYDQDDDLPSLNIELTDNADDDANFRFENDPKAPDQRNTVIERRGLVNIRCKVRDIVHGQCEGDDEAECTLLVLLFRFFPDDMHRRVKQARINITFVGPASDRSEPEVIRIYPDGMFALHPTKRMETVCTKGGGSIKGGMGPEVGADLSREKSVVRELESMGKVYSDVYTEGRDYGEPNSVSWTLMENSDTKSGVPASMQCAILVKRADIGGKFAASVKVTAQADRRTAVEDWAHRLFRPVRPDAPLLFDPEKAPTNRLRDYDKQTLSALDTLNLDDRELTDITLWNVWDKAVKHT